MGSQIQRVIAIDCDLHRIHAWDGLDGEICTQERTTDRLRHWIHLKKPDVVLFEIASATAYGHENKGEMYNLCKWMIFNVAIACSLADYIAGRADLAVVGTGARFLVAPSSSWTLGYDLEKRHKLAAANARNKDLRECQAMLWFYGVSPGKWTEYDRYIDSL